MAYLIFKHIGGFWRKITAVTVRKVRNINLGYKSYKKIP
jgi:hypothetical protein